MNFYQITSNVHEKCWTSHIEEILDSAWDVHRNLIIIFSGLCKAHPKNIRICKKLNTLETRESEKFTNENGEDMLK